jgi:porphobilinogen synthase
MYPEKRMRRLRRRRLLPLFAEHHLRTDQLIAPLFVDEGATEPVPIPSMPGQSRYPIVSVDTIAAGLFEAGIRSVLLFGVPVLKDAEATSAWTEDGVVQQAVRRIRDRIPGMVVITDLCACEYTNTGQCGINGECRDGGPDLDNDRSLALMQRIAVSHARAGADIVAPSCMLDGVVQAVRSALDDAGFTETLIMSYSSKFASALYGPFREAADSGCTCGDRKTYQINPSNGREAFVESRLDADEGADVLMVKPAGLYLDVIAEVATLDTPVAAYQVSGEYAMICAASERGWLDKRATALESLLAIRRAGADLIITYFAEDAAQWLTEDR